MVRFKDEYNSALETTSEIIIPKKNRIANLAFLQLSMLLIVCLAQNEIDWIDSVGNCVMTLALSTGLALLTYEDDLILHF
jgi:hypothetical protein